MSEPSEVAKAAKKINYLAGEVEGDLLNGHLERIIQRLLDERDAGKDAEIERLKKQLAEAKRWNSFCNWR